MSTPLLSFTKRQLRRFPGPWWREGYQRQVLFIASSVRSGSTWLSYVLGNHPRSAHLGEYHRPFEISGHVACRLCEAQGLPDCEILHGIEDVPINAAYGFALDRFGSAGINTVVDCSKQLDWLQTILDAGGGADGHALPIKVIHLIRDPRGWLASQWRRIPDLDPDVAIEQWRQEFYATSEFIKKNQLPSIRTTYDQLCLAPQTQFRRLARFTALPFETRQLAYWTRKHHGLGGNGASLNNLEGKPFAQTVTGDDDFYLKHLNQNFYDRRWLESEQVERLRALASNPRLAKILQESGCSFDWIDKQMQA